MQRTTSPFGSLRPRSLGFIVMLALALPACKDSLLPPDAQGNARVDEVTVSPEITFLQVGETRKLHAVPRDAYGRALSGREIHWTSSDASIASVDGSGTVTAKKTGSVSIRAISDGRSGQARVDVFTPYVAVDSIHVEQDSVVLQRGGIRQLRATARAADGSILADRHLTWSGDRPGMVQVDEAGRIIAYHVGTMWVTVSHAGKSARIKVIVQPAPEYHLRSAAGSPLPAAVYTGSYTLPNGEVRDVVGTVTDGFLWLTDDGRYLMTVMRVSYENGVPMGSGNAFYDQGEYTRSATGELEFRSIYFRSVNGAPTGPGFTGQITATGLSLTQSVYMNAPPVTFIYERQ